MDHDRSSGTSSGTARTLLGTTRTLLAALFREEWRLHARLFGGRRFVLFPAFVAAVVAVGSLALSTTGTETATVVGWLHAFVLAFGLYSGTAGFAGSDMLENVFGRLTLVLSSAAYLPVSRRRLLGAFLVKDAVYYGGMFVAPVAVGTAPLFASATETPSVAGVSPETPTLVATATLVGALFASLLLVFAAGMATTVTLIAFGTRGVPVRVLVIVALVGTVSAWVTGRMPVSANALVMTERGPSEAAAVLVGVVIVGAAALALYDPTPGRSERRGSDRFAAVAGRVPGADDGLVAKSLLDLARSSGGVWKPLVSAGILFALVAGLIGVVGAITGIEPAPGIFFGGVLALSAFTTYNWLTQFDGLEAYLAFPVSVEAVFRAKRTAFVLVGTPAVAVPYVAGVAWYRASPLDVAAGAAVLAGFSLYFYGLTVYVAGFDPNEFLFDPLRFAAFTAGVAVPLVPTLVVAFVIVPPTPALAAGLALIGLLVGGVGHGLSRRAGPRWRVRYRSGLESAGG